MTIEHIIFAALYSIQKTPIGFPLVSYYPAPSNVFSLSVKGVFILEEIKPNRTEPNFPNLFGSRGFGS